jgi:hypothetical protein
LVECEYALLAFLIGHVATIYLRLSIALREKDTYQSCMHSLNMGSLKKKEKEKDP